MFLVINIFKRQYTRSFSNFLLFAVYKYTKVPKGLNHIWQKMQSQSIFPKKHVETNFQKDFRTILHDILSDCEISL